MKGFADVACPMQARNEVRVLASLNHPNIVKYYETFVDGSSGKLQIVMEFCEVQTHRLSFPVEAVKNQSEVQSNPRSIRTRCDTSLICGTGIGSGSKRFCPRLS